MRTRFLKSSGRTSLAIAAKSSGFLMSCFGKDMPPFGHSRRALCMASSSVRAQLTWSCRSFGTDGLPASAQPSSHSIQSSLIFSSVAPTVIIPCANLPVRFALTGPDVAT
jgi:hypothetical protein